MKRGSRKFEHTYYEIREYRPSIIGSLQFLHQNTVYVITIAKIIVMSSYPAVSTIVQYLYQEIFWGIRMGISPECYFEFLDFASFICHVCQWPSLFGMNNLHKSYPNYTPQQTQKKTLLPTLGLFFLLVGLRECFGKIWCRRGKKRILLIFLRNIPQCLCRRRN
jgi:hypothetical protein